MEELPVWLVEFLRPQQPFSLWTILNSPFLVAVITVLIGIYLGREVNLAREFSKESAENTPLRLRAQQELESNSRDKLTSDVDDKTLRNELHSLFKIATSIVKEAEDGDKDGRRRRTYKAIKWDTITLAGALFERGQLTWNQFVFATEVIRLHQRYNKGRAIEKPIINSDAQKLSVLKSMEENLEKT
jgi:hypothetical protein